VTGVPSDSPIHLAKWLNGASRQAKPFAFHMLQNLSFRTMANFRRHITVMHPPGLVVVGLQSLKLRNIERESPSPFRESCNVLLQISYILGHWLYTTYICAKAGDGVDSPLDYSPKLCFEAGVSTRKREKEYGYFRMTLVLSRDPPLLYNQSRCENFVE
jgi:hypothetical protein